MTSRTATKWGRNPLLVVALLVAFSSRALIPTGFMPGPGGLVICLGYVPGAGAAAAHVMMHDMSAMDMSGVDMSGTDASRGAGHPTNGGGSPRHEGSGSCPFAAVATTLASGQTAMLVTVVHPVVARISLPHLPVIPRGTIVPTRLPRGPPVLPA